MGRGVGGWGGGWWGGGAGVGGLAVLGGKRDSRGCAVTEAGEEARAVAASVAAATEGGKQAARKRSGPC